MNLRYRVRYTRGKTEIVIESNDLGGHGRTMACFSLPGNSVRPLGPGLPKTSEMRSTRGLRSIFSVL